VPEDGMYTFYTASDDGSRLWLNGKLVVDNDGLHGMREKSGIVALSAGHHELLVRYFEKTGGDDLEVLWESEKMAKQKIPASALFISPGK